MAQGPLKKASTKAKTSNPHWTKKGLRAIPPKRSSLVKQAGITKKHSAGLTAKTERGLAGKVGHLELLEGGKRSGKVGGGRNGGGKEAKKGAKGGLVARKG